MASRRSLRCAASVRRSSVEPLSAATARGPLPAAPWRLSAAASAALSQQPPGYFPPPPKSNSKKIVFIVLGVIAGLTVLVIGGGVALYLAFGQGTVTATDVKMGDCLAEIPGDTRVLTVKTIDCDETHAGEVFAVLQMPDGDFPGQAAIETYADNAARSWPLFTRSDDGRLRPAVRAVPDRGDVGAG